MTLPWNEHIGLKVLPRTIAKVRGVRLKELFAKRGRRLSELVREVVKEFSC